jgi:hypothetical protein
LFRRGRGRVAGGRCSACAYRGRAHNGLVTALPSTRQVPDDRTADADTPPAPPRSRRTTGARATFVQARTCYDHLAGRLGVEVTDAMTGAGLLRQDGGFALTEAGLAWLTTRLGVDPAALRRTRRPLARACLDLTERRPHLAGAAGAAVCRTFLERGWVVRAGSGRAVSLTPAGGRALRRLLPIDTVTLS